ncbi:hypothetical protein RB199_34965 [Streptomyces libani]|uniref:hypothetical protein n=1 Tax=Streptomyces TaxID=1883 RepID=UPI000D6F1CAB|nr:hypothetical protein [Streptomyces sp. NEAU-S7GS2]AWN28868.1 hypothetical protein DKG71_24485 [Streptomyces sp. NEAU-S7GS2]
MSDPERLPALINSEEENAAPAVQGGGGDQPEHERTADNDSEALTGLRVRVHRDYVRRQQYGPLGRSL